MNQSSVTQAVFHVSQTLVSCWIQSKTWPWHLCLHHRWQISFHLHFSITIYEMELMPSSFSYNEDLMPFCKLYWAQSLVSIAILYSRHGSVVPLARIKICYHIQPWSAGNWQALVCNEFLLYYKWSVEPYGSCFSCSCTQHGDFQICLSPAMAGRDSHFWLNNELQWCHRQPPSHCSMHWQESSAV